MDPVYSCDHLFGEEGAGCFSCLSVACVVSVMVCLLFFFPFSVVGGLLVVIVAIPGHLLYYLLLAKNNFVAFLESRKS